MNGSHGREGRAGIARLGAALAAAGLLLASGPSPARACPITHHDRAAASTPAPAAASTPGDFEQAFRDFLKTYHPATPPAPAATPVPAPPAAAELLTPPPTTVASHGAAQPCGCPPPPPCSATPPPSVTPPNTTPLTPPAPQVLGPPASLSAQATPEPSTIVSALGLLGVAAWRRRAARPRS